jgi:hypothetical protein
MLIGPEAGSAQNNVAAMSDGSTVWDGVARALAQLGHEITTAAAEVQDICARQP